MLIHNYINIRTRNIGRDKERHYIIIKKLIQQNDITILSETAPDINFKTHEAKCFQN